ncbi:MAG: tetratricopeptide repeat protein [Tannerellaceae bacterium]|nr:tetratricopeptide repeat protein [Tannerellaceae bacterium]
METIRQLITEGKTDQAICLLDKILGENAHDPVAYYLRGNAYRKQGDFRQALNNYLSAIEIDPGSPAVEAHKMLMGIMKFYNKNLYNP